MACSSLERPWPDVVMMLILRLTLHPSLPTATCNCANAVGGTSHRTSIIWPFAPCLNGPNLGFGRFGAKVTTSNAPRFDRQFDPARLRLFDVDGSGTTDVVYVGGDAITLWMNQSGNGWGPAQVLTRDE